MRERIQRTSMLMHLVLKGRLVRWRPPLKNNSSVRLIRECPQISWQHLTAHSYPPYNLPTLTCSQG